MVGADKIDAALKCYHELESYDMQNAYLLSNIKPRPVIRRRTKEKDSYKKQWTYIVKVGQEEILVCRQAYAHIHGVSVGKIQKLINDREISPIGKQFFNSLSIIIHFNTL